MGSSQQENEEQRKESDEDQLLNLTNMEKGPSLRQDSKSRTVTHALTHSLTLVLNIKVLPDSVGSASLPETLGTWETRVFLLLVVNTPPGRSGEEGKRPLHLF